MHKMSAAGPVGDGAGDSRACTINTKKHRWRASWEAVLEIQERHHQCNKYRWWAPLEAVPEIWECSPTTLKNVDDRPLGGDAGDLGAPTINAKKHQ
jgi:hypothetical protein